MSARGWMPRTFRARFYSQADAARILAARLSTGEGAGMTRSSYIASDDVCAPFTFDFEPAYRADGWGAGIAWRVDGFETETVPGEWRAASEDEADFATENEDDPCDDTLYVWDEEYDRPTGRLVAHMIGDDRPFTFESDELSPIADGDYCDCCGQIGCPWGGGSDE